MKRKQPSSRNSSSFNPSVVFAIQIAALVAACLTLYIHTTSFSYTELDDRIFIRELESYNRSASYWQSFRRGVFSDTADTYYRPLLLNSFVWDRQREGETSFTLHSADSANDDISQYHWTNILLHVGAVVLLFVLLRRLLDNHTFAFLLAMIVAVHPVLAQAVVWIPGRNDTLLAVFTFGFLVCVIEYLRKKSFGYLTAQVVLLFGALFTKETGVIAAPVAFFVALLVNRVSLKDKHLWIASVSWVAALAIWIFVRLNATVKTEDISFVVLVSTLIERLPLAVQYLGKIILPFNLSVFPWQEDTTMWFGVAVIALLAVGIAFAQQRDWRTIAVGCIWYIAFLLPALIVPKAINREAFEHRLYLPIVGVLILLTETVVFQRFDAKKILYGGLVLCLLLGVFNYSRSSVFNGKFAFWESAVATTPSSAYAKMMLGARYHRDAANPRKEEGVKLLMEAYRLDSTQKYLNYYLGSVMMDGGNWVKMEEFLAKETAPDQPIRIEMYSNRARGFIERKMFAEAEPFLLKWKELAPNDNAVNTNLLLYYLNDFPQPEKARAHAREMMAKGIPVPPQVMKVLGL